MKISSFIDKDLVKVNVEPATKEKLIAEIVDRLCICKKLKNREKIFQALTEREKKGSTGIGEGIAIPHARIEGLKEPVIFAGTLGNGIDFNSLDGKPVRLVILFLTPFGETEMHLKLLSQLASLLGKNNFVAALLLAKTDEELYTYLKQEEFDKLNFLSLTKDEICKELDTSEKGLSQEEAQKRLQEYGMNELKKAAKSSLWKRFFSNFTNTLAILMWVGSALAFFAKMPEIGWAIVGVIIINAFFSFWQEFRAEKALEALKNLIPCYVRVIRDNEEKKILAAEVVPGDIVVMEEGDNIPADCRLIESDELRVDNSVFTGESRPGYKMAEAFHDGKNFLWTELPNLVFAGTSVVMGRGKAIIFATGMSTEIGRIAYITQTIKEELSPLQKEINKLTKVIAIVAVILGIGFLFVGYSIAHLSFLGSAMFAIGIILGNVPEGLMPTVTLSLAMAVQRMAKRNALIKKLSSVETLGCTNVICTDKTGTLTTSQLSANVFWLNEKTVRVTGADYEPKGEFMNNGKNGPASSVVVRDDRLDLLMQNCVLCNTAKLISPSEKNKQWSILGDPTEAALLVLAKKAGFDIEKEREAAVLIKRFPFESVRKRMSSMHRMQDNQLHIYAKGGPKEILDLCNRIIIDNNVVFLTPEKKNEIMGQVDSFASEGLRVLGFGCKDIKEEELKEATAETAEKDLVFTGLIAMYDPPRPEVYAAIKECKNAGIRVVMITGDYGLTALTIAKSVGIVASDDARVVTGNELTEMPDEELKDILKKEVVFARVNPEHKLRVVTVFKDMGNIVAVTGDGVNDAPALKKADIGVAMGIRGTEVAKEASEMVLADDNFASIVYAIEEGRAVFSNIKKFITYIFAHLVPEAVPFILYIIFRLPVPITAMQILAIDIGTETLPALALGIEKPEKGIMNLPPRPRGRGLVDKIVLFRGYIYLGLLNSAAVIAAYFIVLFRGGWRFGMQLEPNEMTFTNPVHLKATTMIFAGIVVMQIANIFSCRSEDESAFKTGLLSNKLIIWGIVFEILFTCALIYVPFLQKIFSTTAIGWKEWGMLFVFMIIIFFLEELRKKFFVKKRQ